MYAACVTLTKVLSVLTFLSVGSPGWSYGHYTPPVDTLNKSRLYSLTATGGVLYGSALIALNNAWYKNTERSSFHTFNDWKEWRNMDKLGHSFTAYFETELTYRGFLWTGMEQSTALWLSAGMGFLYQTTVELFDGFSKKWGFSWFDTGFNVLGVSCFVAQELLWEEQRFRWKLSSWPKQYSDEPIFSNDEKFHSSVKKRAEDLFGKSRAERFLKDYNAQTIWLSVNPNSFFKQSRIPKWLNVALGVSAENLFGGFENRWIEQEYTFHLPSDKFPRYSQLFLAPDIDFSKIPVDQTWLKTIMTVLNIFKFPSPAIQINGQHTISWHWVYL